ncbi:hypothetical protein [Geotalea sp. SG265]|uniref:hypothetical protein n=1 Tax=Geotalea sp. SG265 TaxID=2922867 RepID=UPI001FAFE1CC|nr:hypothetical protein [Geotalea sp. SG265]
MLKGLFRWMRVGLTVDEIESPGRTGICIGNSGIDKELRHIVTHISAKLRPKIRGGLPWQQLLI